MEIHIRTYREMLASFSERDLVCTLGQLYHRAVHAIDSAIYSDREKQAWSPEPPGLDWTQRFRDAPPWIALQKERIIGFMNLQKDAHIDLAFVDPEFQRQGISEK
ncbi:MAG: GNAT family N-acetyltransferase, partial [Leptospiraceae bacterium]|nr:GNAT family N-acetyltransferase [Leptospiraceae bacterium]